MDRLSVGPLLPAAPDQVQNPNDDEGDRDAEELLGPLFGCFASSGDSFRFVEHPLEIVELGLQRGHLLLGIVDLVPARQESLAFVGCSGSSVAEGDSYTTS